MSQHDLSIANQGFPAFRSDLNDALQALGSMQSGATAPSTTYANMVWYDTANNVIKVRNEDNDAWITMVGFDQTTDILNKVGIFSFPTADGSANQVLTTNGSGTLSFTTLASDKITEGNSSVEVVDTGNGYITFTTDGNEVARIDANGRFGIDVTPAASYTGHSNLQIGAQAILAANKSLSQSGQTYLSHNLYFDTGGNWAVFNTSNSNEGAAIQLVDGEFNVQSSAATTGSPSVTQILNTKKDYSLALQGATFKSGTGITFPSSQNASSDANTLDDYEEGTWTPSIKFSGANVGVTYVLRGGYYTKIGSIVQASCYIGLSNKGSSTGNLFIDDFPFSLGGNSAQYTCATIWVIAVTSNGYINGYINPSDNKVNMQSVNTSGTSNQMNNTNVSNNSEFMINITYRTV